MRTSKKILSFFLAVVMVVTTCSVGFTAFAAEKKDSIWSTNCGADEAFATLNDLADELLPELLINNIGLVGDGVFQKYAKDYGKTYDKLTDKEKAEIVDKATLTDVLQALQPTLIGALAKESQSDYAIRVGGGHPKDPSYYDYLQRDGALDFYTLYALCDDNRANRDLSQSTRDTLTEWYNILRPIANIELVNLTDELVNKLHNSFENIYEGEGVDHTATNLYGLKNFYTDEFMNANTTAEERAALEALYAEKNTELETYGVNYKITDFAELTYYCYGMGTDTKYVQNYLNLIASTGTEIKYSSDEDLFDMIGSNLPETVTIPDALTIDNYSEKLIVYYFSSAFGLGDPSEVTVDMVADMFAMDDDGNVNSELAAYFKGTLLSLADQAMLNKILTVNYENDIVNGLAIKYSDQVNNMDDLTKMVEAQLPADYLDSTKLFDDNLTKNIASAFVTCNSYGKLFVNGSLNTTDGLGSEINLSLPESLQNTYVSEYFGLVLDTNFTNNQPNGVNYKNDLRSAFYSGILDSAINSIALKDGSYQTIGYITNNNIRDQVLRQTDGTNLAVLNFVDASSDYDVINTYLEDAVTYAYTQTVADLLGITSFITDNSKDLNLRIDYKKFIDSHLPEKEETKVVLTDEQKAILNGDYNLVNDMGTEIVNYILNKTVMGVLDPSSQVGGIINDLISGLVDSDVDIVSVIDGIWAKLCKDPINTLVGLLPLLTVFIDEMILPLIFNQEGDQGYNTIYGILDLEIIGAFTGGAFFLRNMLQENGSHIGIAQVGWDLNTLLPQLMDWLLASKKDQKAKNVEGISYYDGNTVELRNVVMDENGEVVEENGKILCAPVKYTKDNFNSIDFNNYTVKDANGKLIEKVEKGYLYNGNTYSDSDKLFEANEDAVFTCFITYEASVPKLTNIYLVDKMLGGACIDDLSAIIGGTGGDILGEIIDEIATLFGASVHQFVDTPELRNATRYHNDGRIAFSGLNNIFVAIPQLFDIMENLAAEKYGISKDEWVYCYEGRISTKEITAEGRTYTSTVNSLAERFKSYAADPDSVDILDCFAELLVENWMNSVVDLVDNVIATDNKISSNLTIIIGLLESLGGFGEQSIITDIANSVFQLTREDKYSFTFTDVNTDPNNKMTGLSKDNAYFLITNISRLVEVIKNLIAHFNEPSTQSVNGFVTSAAADDEGGFQMPSLPLIKNLEAAPAARATSANYSSSDLSNAKDLIGNLDKMLSSLLSDSSLNGFSLDSAENLIAGIVSLLDRFLGMDINLGKNNEIATDIVLLVNQYLYFITGESENLTAKDGKVDPKKVYTNNALTGLVVETYALIEKIADSLLVNFYDTYDNNSSLKYNLLVEAIDGIISPDAVGIRLGDYKDAQKKLAKYDTWTIMSEASSRHNYKNLSIDWGIKGNAEDRKEAFYDGLSASLRLVTSILGVLLVETGWYQTVLTPLLGMFCTKNDIKMETIEALKKDKAETGYYDKTLIAILTPVSELLNKFLKAPVTTLIQSIQGMAGFIDDKNTECGTIGSLLKGIVAPITKEVRGLGKIFGLKTAQLPNGTSPTLNSTLISVANMADTLANVKTYEGIIGCELTSDNIIPLINVAINNALEKNGIKLEFKLRQISWSKLYSSSPEAALVYILEYVLETLLDSNTLDVLLAIIKLDKNYDQNLVMIIELIKAGDLDAKSILKLLNQVLEITDNPTLVYWTFAQYLQEMTENFKYPAGMTKAMADQGVDALDNLVKNIFPLLGSFGVNLGADDLKGILSTNLFKNELITKLAVTLYGALDGLDPTIKTVLAPLGIVTSTKDVAKILTDTSYGATYSSAANAIAAQSSWKNVKNVNWGFTDGSAKAQQGFVNALVAVLRPLNGVLQVFLGEGTLELNNVVSELVNTLSLTINEEFALGNTMSIKITGELKNGVLTLNIRDGKRARSTTSTVKLDLRSLKELTDLKIEGTNGYNSAIIPLMEAFKLSNVKTYNQYKNDINAAKDNLLLDILNPIAGDTSSSLINKLVDKPFDTLTDLLPNLAMYLDAHGLSQLINNLLAPITGLIASVAETLDIDGKVKAVLGVDLGTVVGTLLGVKTKIDLDLTDLSKLNIEDLIIPIVRIVLANNDNPTVRSLKLYDINWNALISLGDKMTYTSAATGANGSYLTGKMVGNVDQGKVLITVLRYIAKTLTTNIPALKSLLLGIDKIKDSDVLTAVISSVLNTLSTASEDQIIMALFYFIAGEPTNAFWDYTKYKTGQYSFSYPEGMEVDFLKNLPPMLDGMIASLLNLNELVTKNLFTDSLVSKLATGLYGAIEGVKINDDLGLTALLAQTDIDFTTANVAKLLTDKSYGKTFEGPASVIANAGSWKNVNADSLKWGVTDRDSFFHALVAVLRPLYGVLDVLLNDAQLGLFDLVRIPGSNGYSSSIVPLLEAFSCYNVKTQYQYRQDINKEYDAILLDIINPIWDVVEDVLNAPLQTVTAMIPNLALFIGNNGLSQMIDNLLTPISALADAIRPIVDLNDLLDTLFDALDVDLNGLLGKVGITNFSIDVYDLNKTLSQVLAGDKLIPLINNVLGLIKIKGTPLGIKLNAVDWLQLASHGTTIVSASQAATFGSRVFVQGDSSEVLIAILRYLINTINSGDNYNQISSLIGGLLGGADDTISGVVDQVLGMLQDDTDTVIASLVDLLQTLGS
ncbi:MAG: hypothetical protein K2J41_09420 [Eubacterium sp.]|nr:hypothetical protein [Eubacterium sp.]